MNNQKQSIENAIQPAAAPAPAPAPHIVTLVAGSKVLIRFVSTHDGDVATCFGHLNQFVHFIDRLFEEKVQQYLEKITLDSEDATIIVQTCAAGVDGLLKLFNDIHDPEPKKLPHFVAPCLEKLCAKKYSYIIDISAHTIAFRVNYAGLLVEDFFTVQKFSFDDFLNVRPASVVAALSLLERDLSDHTMLRTYMDIIDNGDATMDTKDDGNDYDVIIVPW